MSSVIDICSLSKHEQALLTGFQRQRAFTNTQKSPTLLEENRHKCKKVGHCT